MANDEHVALLQQSVAAWNAWRAPTSAAMRLLRPLAEQGYASAQADLGVMYALD